MIRIIMENGGIDIEQLLQGGDGVGAAKQTSDMLR